MALTVQEIIKLKKESTGIFEITSEVALRHAQFFYNVHKEIDSETHPLAASYQNKKYQLCRQVVRLDFASLKSIYNLALILLGNGTITYNEVISPEFDWEGKLEVVIPRTFEIVSDIRTPEINEYNGV